MTLSARYIDAALADGQGAAGDLAGQGEEGTGVMDHDRIVEIGARALAPGCFAQKQHSRMKSARRKIADVLAAFEEAGLVVVERQALLDAAEIAGSINVEGNQRLASALRAAAKADPQ